MLLLASCGGLLQVFVTDAPVPTAISVCGGRGFVPECPGGRPRTRALVRDTTAGGVADPEATSRTNIGPARADRVPTSELRGPWARRSFRRFVRSFAMSR